MSLLPSEPDTSAAEESDPRVIGVDSDAADDLIAALSSETAREILAALHDEPAPPARLAERVDTSLQNVQYHLERLAEAGAVEVIDTAYSEKGREMDVYAPADRPLVIFAGEESRTPTLREALSRLLGGIGVVALGSVVVQSLYGDTGLFGAGGGPPTGYGGDNTTGGTDTMVETAADGGADAGDVVRTTTETVVEVDGGEATQTAVETVTETQAETAAETATATQSPTPAETVTQTPTATSTETVTQSETPIETVTETVDAVTTVAPDGSAGLPPGLLFFAGGVTALVVLVGFWYVWR